VGKQAQDIIEKKLQAILNKVRNGTGTPYLAVQEARLWGSNSELNSITAYESFIFFIIFNL
jgi:hypothetical protein